MTSMLGEAGNRVFVRVPAFPDAPVEPTIALYRWRKHDRAWRKIAEIPVTYGDDVKQYLDPNGRETDWYTLDPAAAPRPRW